MIEINESVPKKISGVTSLIVSFPYNAEVINILKQCDRYVYDKESKCWEIPTNFLAFLLDELTYYDDITLKLIKDEGETHYYPKLVNKYKTKPFQHQLEGIEWGLNLKNGGLLLDDPGLGKSLQMIYLAEELKAQKGLEHCLIICGINSLKGNWKSEIEKHSSLPCRVIGEKVSRKGTISYRSNKERAKELKEPLKPFFYIINIESLRDPDIVKAIKTSKNKIDMIVVDECHCSASAQSQQSQGLLKLTEAKLKIGLTGTLLTNTVLNAYIPLKWIGVEKATWTGFKSLFCEYGGYGGHQIVGFKNVDVLKDEIDTCSLRRTKDILKDLPPKTVICEKLDMNDAHKTFYENVKEGIKEECELINLDANNVLALTTRLLQATTCPSVLTTKEIMSTKIERAVSLVEELCGHNEKVVIMSKFKEPIYELEKLLKNYNPLRGDGDIPDDQFQKNIKLFQEDNKYKVFLGTHQKAGTGITLNKASYMILLDCPWTAAKTKQIEDRIHRIGSEAPVFIYRLVCAGTVDEIVQKAIEKKAALSDFMIDDKCDNDTINILKDYILSL